MASRGSQDVEDIDEQLVSLEINIKRLRIEYEQFFKGAMRREPYQLLAQVQKTVTRFSSDPPRRVAQKFRFNSLVARFQCLRQMWGRVQREMDQGSYKPHQFRARLASTATAKAEPKRESTNGTSAIDQLTDALLRARKETGEETRGVSTERIGAMVDQQRRTIAKKYGNDVKVAFRVVIEDGKAKVKANVKRRS
jgi:hypothetical protein